MNQQPAATPSSRNWRDISQSVKPRVMSRGGRWRLFLTGLRMASVGMVLGALGWGVWVVTAALQDSPQRVPAAAKAVPMRAPELVATRDGVLDHAWLVRTLRLPAGISLTELDLGRLRARLLADRQVLTADLTKVFPDRLKVWITERAPIARARIEDNGVLRDLLIARDGMAFSGTGFDPAMLETLPWLDGVKLARDGNAYRAVEDLEPVGRLLADAQFWAPHLYRTWQTLSLARLSADREIEVLTKGGIIAVLSAKNELHREFVVQLARLDHITDQLSRRPHAWARIDLSLGREVPVKIQPLEPGRPARGGLKPVSSPFLSAFSSYPLKSKT